ncbi:MAG: VPA1267 family protein [Burkholderiales bacterium]
MASGRQKGEENVTRFISWMTSKSDAEFRDMATRGQLSRQEIARECDFARSVLIQNPRIRELLRAQEDELRSRGVLPPRVESPKSDPDLPASQPSTHTMADQQRLKRLEAENAALRAEITKLRADLNRYRILDAILAETGRLLR